MLRNFGWIREPQVAGMAYPEPGAPAELQAVGVGAVLSLTERPPNVAFASAGIVHAHAPFVDFGTPSQSQLDTCVAFIREQVADGRGVVVHCMAGQGRTGTVLAAWLVDEGLGGEEAVAEVRRLRPGSIETRGQVGVILARAARRTDGGDQA